MAKWVENLVVFGIGGSAYVGLEYLWRGFSHPTMFLVGGLCFLLLGWVPTTLPLWAQMGLGTVVILAMEFASGCVVNLWLGWNVWDYSALSGNLLGQICLLYGVLWWGLSLPALWCHRQLRRWLVTVHPYTPGRCGGRMLWANRTQRARYWWQNPAR